MGRTRKTKLGDTVLPVSPIKPEIVALQLNKRLTSFNTRTISLKGNRDVAAAIISSFFPSRESPFYRYADMSPKKYKAKTENWEGNKEIRHLITADIGVNLVMLIDKCSFRVKEGGGDMYYMLKLSEYRNLTVPTVSISLRVRDSGLKQRPDEAASTGTHTVGSGDALQGIAEKAYGSGIRNFQIYTTSSAVIEAATKQHGKSSSNNGWWIYPGTVLAIL